MTCTYLGRSLDVRTSILLEAEIFDNIGFGTHKTEGKEDKLGGEKLLRSWDFLHFPATTTIFGPLDTDWVDLSFILLETGKTLFNYIPVFNPVRLLSSSTTKSLVDMQYSRGSSLRIKKVPMIQRLEILTVPEMSSNFNVTIVSPENTERRY